MCDHIGKVLKWGVDIDARLVATLYGCTLCDWISVSPPLPKEDETNHSHIEYVDGCFACKLQTLQLNTGDAGNNRGGWTQKKWDGELNAYRAARAQGIQPKSTRMVDIQAAVEISNKTGKAFDASA